VVLGWTIIQPMAENKDIFLWNIFGSQTSIDCDVAVVIDEKQKPSKPDQASALCKKYCELLDGTVKKKPINVNLVMLRDGIIMWVHKGTADEVNNSIFYTHSYHKELQQHECFVKKPVVRRVDLKIVRSIRVILSYLTKTEDRAKIKDALWDKKVATTVSTRLDALRTVEFEKVVYTKGHEKFENMYKVIAFQIGQLMGLFEGKELYSKTDIAAVYPQLTKFLMRQEGDLGLLTKCLRELIARIDVYIKENPKVAEIRESLCGA
jgi:hypothetical protein